MATADLNARYLTELYRKVPIETFFLTKVFGKPANVRMSPTLKVNVRVETRGMTIAALGKVGDPPHAVNITHNVTEMDMSPAQIFEYDMLDEESIFSNANPEVLAWGNLGDVVNNRDYLRAMKLQGLKLRVTRRVEEMIAEILTAGKIDYNDGERAYSVSFGVSTTAYTLTTSTNIYKDLLGYADDMRKAGRNPDTIIITKSVEDHLFDNTYIKDFINKYTFNLAQMQMNTYPNARDTIQLKGLPKFTVYLGTYVDTTGATKNYIDGDKIILADSSAFRLGYGAMVNFDVNPQGTPMMTDVLAWEKVSDDGTHKRLYTLSRPLPYLVSTDALKILDVTFA